MTLVNPAAFDQNPWSDLEACISNAKLGIAELRGMQTSDVAKYGLPYGHRACEAAKYGQGWIRTSEGVKPADLQSAPFGHFGTYPANWLAMFTATRLRLAVGRPPGRKS
jgi:hypothetical protein